MIPIQIDPVGTKLGVMTLDNGVGDFVGSSVFDAKTGIVHMTEERRNYEWSRGMVLRRHDGVECLRGELVPIGTPEEKSNDQPD